MKKFTRNQIHKLLQLNHQSLVHVLEYLNIKPEIIYLGSGKTTKHLYTEEDFEKVKEFLKIHPYPKTFFAEQTNIKKYGVKNTLLIKEAREKANKKAWSAEIREKRKNTNIEKYGAVTPLLNTEIFENTKNIRKQKIDSIVEKTKQTFIKKYGVDNPQKNEKIKEKTFNTNIKKYGAKSVFNSPIIRDKINNTLLQRYGTVFFSKTEQYRNSVKENCLKKYGVDSPNKLRCVRQKQSYKYKLLKYYNNNKIYFKPYKEFKNINDITVFKDYKIINFDSKPEIALYIFLTNNNIDFEYQPKNNEFIYEYNNVKHIYIPDFKVNNYYIELKGNQFLTKDNKWQNPYNHLQDDLYEAKHQLLIKNNVIILYNNDYKKFLDYINEIYGKDFLKDCKVCKQ